MREKTVSKLVAGNLSTRWYIPILEQNGHTCLFVFIWIFQPKKGGVAKNA